MNTNSNVYTVIYSTVLVVIVAAVLAFAATALKPMQDENVKKETITQVLSAAFQAAGNGIAEAADVMSLYAEKAVAAFYVNGHISKPRTTSSRKSKQVRATSSEHSHFLYMSSTSTARP